MRYFPYLAALAAISAVSGCANQSANPPQSTPATKSAPASGSVSVPPDAAIGSASTLTSTPQFNGKIAALEKSGKDKKALAAVYAERGYARMTDDNAAPRVKYRAALSDFRGALKLDPTNAKAKQNLALIEGIYKSMGRPIPSSEGDKPGASR